MITKLFCASTNTFIEDEFSKYKLTGATEKMNSVRCAVFIGEDGQKYLKPWDSFVHVRKFGEANKFAKLTTLEVKEIIKTFYFDKDVTMKFLGDKYGVTARTISGLVKGTGWRHITRKLIRQIRDGEDINKPVVQAKVVQASNTRRKRNTKISAPIAKFIVRDHFVNKIKPESLAEKYCLSDSSIKRILSGKAWKEVTIPAIAEYKVWK